MAHQELDEVAWTDDRELATLKCNGSESSGNDGLHDECRACEARDDRLGTMVYATKILVPETINDIPLKTFTYPRISTVDIHETRGFLIVDLEDVVGPADTPPGGCKQPCTTRIRDNIVPAHVVAIVILLVAPELANRLALERHVAGVVEARE